MRLRNEPVSKVVIYDAFPRLVPGNKGRVVVATQIVTCVRGRRRGERGRGRSGKMRRRAGRRFLAITSEGKFTIIETTAAACVNFACKCAYATPSLDHHPPFFSPKPSSPPFILPSSSFFFLLPTRSLLRPASCQPLVSFSLPLADRAPPSSWISFPFSPRRRPQETTSKGG